MGEELKSSLFADIWAHVKKEWHHLKAAPLAFVFLLLIGGWAGWLVKGELWAAATAADKNHIQDLDSRLTHEENDNNRLVAEKKALSEEVAGLKAYRAQDLPLKKKALILVHQIGEFTKDWKDTDDLNKKMENTSNYLKRFGLRASIIRDDLDQNGQNSKTLDGVMYDFHLYNYNDVRTIEDEIERLANSLPD
jgi:hypothetical protein